jgi:hypothetical protein
MRLGASPKKAYKYLISLVDINLSGVVDIDTLNEDLITMTTRGKQAAAARLGVSSKIILPVDNIILAEELERESKEKDDIIEAKDTIIDEQAKEIAELKKRLGEDE